MTRAKHIGAVVIGRNEGPRLLACLKSCGNDVQKLIYVDSGSQDNSVAAAQKLGAEVVILPTDLPFTAARARNAGLTRLQEVAELDYVHFIDGDCELRDGWLEQARQFLEDHPDVAVVCGRRRERDPDASVYNRMIDAEWDTPIGETRSCGGDALMRIKALDQVGGFNPILIAGEEPELCVRLRRSGWKVWRLDAEMTWHDAALTRFSQWWHRARRAGHAYAQGASLHGAPPERHNITPLRRSLFWGVGVPAASLLGALIHPALLAGLLLYPLQVMRLAVRDKGWIEAVFSVLGKFPEAQGALQFYINRLRGQGSELIEYK